MNDNRILLILDWLYCITSLSYNLNITLSPDFLVSIPEDIIKQLYWHITCLAKEDYISLLPQRDIQSIRGIYEGANLENYRDRSLENL